VDDVNISRSDIEKNYKAFNFSSKAHIDDYEKLLVEGFNVISDALKELDQIFVDTKFEFGYVTDKAGKEKLIYMDEVGTPDSSRIWDGPAYRNSGKVIENSKEGFRQLLLKHFPDPDIFTNKDRMAERKKLATDNLLPQSVLMEVSKTYSDIAEKITGSKLRISEDPRGEIMTILDVQYGLIKPGHGGTSSGKPLVVIAAGRPVKLELTQAAELRHVAVDQRSAVLIGADGLDVLRWLGEGPAPTRLFDTPVVLDKLLPLVCFLVWTYTSTFILVSWLRYEELRNKLRSVSGNALA